MIGRRFADRKKFKPCSFCADKVDDIDFKDTIKLKRYLTERGKIIPRRITGNCSFHQRKLANAVKRARENALIPYIFEG
jgi:small subunit ribosomal protein S18